MLDLVVRGGLVVDGSGLAARRADVGVRDGRIVGLGRIDAAAAREVVDADGLVVMPGIVDHHTHYDPQLDFDPCATPSCLHGVTTVVGGHCGFSIAPCKPEDRDFMTGFFAAVEGMSPSVLGEGLSWSWESFGEYLDALDGRIGVNAAIYVGHSSVRRGVMGEAASERQASEEELRAMEEMVAAALAAGAIGFSSAHLETDRDQFGRVVPSCFASFEEVCRLAEVAGRSGRGSIAFIPDSIITGLDDTDAARLLELCERTRLPVVIQGLGRRLGMEDLWQREVAYLEEVRTRGAALYSSYRVQPYRRPFTWKRGTSLYDGVFEWRELSRLGEGERLARLADPGRRERLRSALDHPNTDGAKGSTLPPPLLDRLYVQRSPRDPGSEGRSVAELAALRGCHAADVMADLCVADALDTEFVWSTESNEWVAATEESARHPNLLVGVGDCGAHADRDDGAEWSTYYLARWVRDRALVPLEEGVRRITHEPAQLLGLAGRGLVSPGYHADLVLVDLPRLGLGDKRLVRDLPGDGERWKVEVEGIERVLVNGRTLVQGGELSECRAGQVLRPGRESA
jgi:N-acyl-D-aspartate/D-glutamate deacylase